jgi:hypothetical protein
MEAEQGGAPKRMGTFPRVAIVGALHMSFIVATYGTRFFHLPVPKHDVIGLWLGGSSSVALLAYLWVLFRSPILPMEPARPMKLAFIAISATLISLYLGIFTAYDTFGS